MTSSKKTKAAPRKKRDPVPGKNVPSTVSSQDLLKDNRWESFFRNSTNKILIVSREGKILDINRVDKPYKKTQVLNRSVYDFLVETSRPVVKKALEKLFKTAKPQEYNSVTIDNKGKKRYYLSKMTPVVENRKVIAAVVDGTEITAEITMREALKQSEEKFKKLSDSATEGIVIHQHGKVAEVNQSICNIFGYPEKSLIGKSIFNYIHPDFHHLTRQKLKKKEEKPYEMLMIRKGKKLFWAEITAKEIVYKGKPARVASIRDISAYKEYEKKIKESEEKFRMLAENAMDVVYRYVFYPKAQYEYVSPSVYALSGYKPEEFYRDPYLGFKVVYPADQHLLGDSENMVRRRSGKTVKAPTMVLRWIKKDGAVIWTETRNKPIFNEKGKLIAIEGITRDVTLQKQSEEKLKESEERFKIISNAAFEGIVFSDNGKIIDANDQFVKMYGFSSRKEFIGKDIVDDFVVEEQKTQAKRSFRLSSSEPFEMQMITRDGQVITVETKGQNIPYFGKSIRATVIYNITERKQYEHSLRESERTLSTLMNNLPGMAYRCDYDDRWTMRFVSKGFQELTGYSPKDFVNNKKRAFADIVFPGDRTLGMPQIKNAIEKKIPFEIEYRIITEKGDVKWVWEKGEGVFGDNGELLFLEGFITDVDDKKKSELALEQSRENYKSLIDNAPDGLLIYRNGFLEFANPTALKLLEAVSMDDIYMKPSFFFLLPEYRERAKERIQLAQKGEMLPFVEIRMRTMNDNIKELEAKPTAIQYNGEPAVMVVLHEIPPQQQLVKQQLRAQIAEETNQKLQQEIAERKNAERILQETQKYTRLLIDSSLDMICASDKEGYITEFNAAAQATFGYTRNEMIGKHVSMLYAIPEERIRITNEELYGKGKYAGEVVNVKKNGEQFVAYLSASVLKDDAGKVVGAMGVSRDISELKKAEQELKLSEEKYKAIYDQAYIGIARVGLRDGDFIEVNQRLCDMLGYTSDELVGMTTWQITHPDDLRTNLPERKAFLSSGSNILSTEKRYIHKNGSVVYANLTITLVKDAAGRPKYFVSVYEDITERKKAEEQLYAQSAKLNAVFESSSHIIWTMDRHYCITSFNNNFARFFKTHYNVEARVGLNMISGDMITSEEYNNFWIRRYEGVFKGESQHFETKLNSRSGQGVWREIFLNPIFDESGNVSELSGIGHDITEKKSAEEKIRQSLQEKEVLLKEVHHRVKNNLQVISSILNLQSSYVKDPSTLNILKESQNRIKSMAFIHESLYQTKDFSSINFSEYVINLSQNLIHSYANMEHEIKLNLDIQNVFLNLDLAIPCGLIINEIVSNALKYAFVDSGREAEITIRISIQGEHVVLMIGDNGVGLPKHIDYRNTESLGLQLVVTLTDQLNGRIDLDTKNGTAYTIIFKQNQVKNRI